MLGNQDVDDDITFLKSPPLYGLVLAGGQSNRMGKDKAILSYHGPSQIEYNFKLLSRFCAKVFLSNRQEQSQRDIYKDYPQILDIFTNIGPMAGILSALCIYPNAGWLVLGCDLPFVGQEILEMLVHSRDPAKMATAYLNSDENLPEPLCAIYEPSSRIRLLCFFDLGIYSLREFLTSSDTLFLQQPDQKHLLNINTREEYREAIELLREDRKHSA